MEQINTKNIEKHSLVESVITFWEIMHGLRLNGELDAEPL